MTEKSIYEYTCTSIDESKVDISQYKGKVMLVVNTASFCGFTPQYRGLEELYRQYKDEGLVVLGFPSNQFGEEPNDNDTINNYCLLNYGVTFPMFAKIKVNGDEAEPLFEHLKSKKAGMFFFKRIHWNFTKFLVDRDGNVVKRFSPLAFPNLIRKHVEGLL